MESSYKTEAYRRLKKEAFKSIKHVIDQQNNLKEILIPEIQDIILSKSRDNNRIERTLDSMLDFLNFKLVESDFKELLNYYSSFEEQGSGFYKQEYQKKIEE